MEEIAHQLANSIGVFGLSRGQSHDAALYMQDPISKAI